MGRHDHRWLLAVVVLWIVIDVLVLAYSASRSAATVIPAGSSRCCGTADSPSGNLSQPATAPNGELVRILLILGARVSEFPDGTEYILTGRDVVVSLWVGDHPTPGHPDSLSVQLVLR